MIDRMLGKYQIIEALGEGGMATVYKGFDPSLERYVAIKIIRTVNQADPDFAIRFQREAKALAKLDHPYILKVLDYGEEKGIPYLVMPYVAYGTLKKYTRSRLPYQKAIEIVIPIAEALSYAHKRNIIHRDIKPANILFGESGEPILSDFGIAKMLDSREQTQLTNTGFGIGTPAYMAPEQWNGVADARTDIYALGIVLYELITGRCPFQADTPAAILIKQVQDPLPRPKMFVSDIPENVEALLFKALAKDPMLRFQTMQDFIQGMNSVLHGKTDRYDLPTQLHVDLNATQIAAKETIICKPVKPPELNQSARWKWLPFAIGGGALLVIIFVVIVAAVVLSKLDIFNLGKPTNVAQQDNVPVQTQKLPAQGDPTSGPHQGVLPDKKQSKPQPSNTETIEMTANSQSVTEIEGFPEDLPLFIPNNGDVTKTTAEGTFMVSFSTNAEGDSVISFYKDEMARLGWNVISTTEMAGQSMSMYAFMKGERSVVLYFMPDASGRTMIQIILGDGG